MLFTAKLDATTLVKSEDYDKLQESYVIFITENDVMGANLPVYHADRIVSETGKPLGDGTHIIYVNGIILVFKNTILFIIKFNPIIIKEHVIGIR